MGGQIDMYSYIPGKPQEISLSFLGKTTCTNSNTYNGGCCTSSDPCAVGGGDCDADSECAGSAICGNNNCVIEFGYSGWEGTADCCTNSTSKGV